MSNKTIQKAITPAAGKRLIGRAVSQRSDIAAVLEKGRLVILAGTTNGYVAEEILTRIGQGEDFDRRRFFRGVTLPANRSTTETGRIPDESAFPGDVVVIDGKWLPKVTIYDIVDDLKSGDIILKGANAVDVDRGRAAIYIGDPRAGTIGVGLQTVVGRRVRLILPVGLEKRVNSDLDRLARLVNAPETKGPRLLPVPGEVFTELEAISLLTGAEAALVAGGGVSGAEGSIWLAVSGSKPQLERAQTLLKEVSLEPNFDFLA
jgi:hypothetical protein